jgi:hypothetical protein
MRMRGLRKVKSTTTLKAEYWHMIQRGSYEAMIRGVTAGTLLLTPEASGELLLDRSV